MPVKRVRKMASIIRSVVLFPTLPVTAIDRPVKRARFHIASVIRASVVSGTTNDQRPHVFSRAVGARILFDGPKHVAGLDRPRIAHNPAHGRMVAVQDRLIGMVKPPADDVSQRADG